MTKQRLLWTVIAVLVAGMATPAQAAPAPKAPTPKVGQKAGAITALLPVATITRGTGKQAITNQAKKGDDLEWNDLLKTLKGGRARVTLTDQSILSLGSQSELKIVKHDTRSQQTALQLYGGRLRAEVSKITRQGGSFELRTPTAVAGVIGTDFGSDASTVGTTVFLCISGIVQVANNDPAVQGSVQCAPGLTTSVTAGKPPTIPTNATPEQIQKLIQDTEPAIISAMTPTSALPGATVDATISGTKLGAVNAVSVSGTGITASLSGTPTDTSVTVHLVVAANATPGPHTITLTKPNAAASAAVFNIMQPPTAQNGDLKKPYHDLFDAERQSNKAGLTALIAAVQQAVDQTLQQLQAANQGNVVNLAPATDSLNKQIAAIQNSINQGATQVDQAVAAALAIFDTQYTAAYNALLQRNPAGVPDATFNQAIQAAYDQVNSSLGLAFANITGGLSTNVKTATDTVGQVQQTWLSTIAAAAIVPPTPKVNNIERSIDLGAAFGSGIIAAPDASSSTGNNGASVVRYSWVLCDSGYKPPQFGVPIPANTPGCSPLSGYASSNADFPFPTCSLTPNDYIARVTVTDTNSQQAALDVKIHVLAGSYDSPEQRVLSLAAAYTTLQVSQFMAFFDETTFAGYSTLSENVRNTFPTLASMNINPRVSQATISCNDAVVRADWVQNYTYQTNPNIPFSQSEQLTIGMTRQPGRGWFINDFRGDNGTVQGQLPGPATTDSPRPDPVVNSVYATYAGASSATGQLVPPGPQSFTAVVGNLGGADLAAATSVRFSLLDSGSNTLTTSDVPLTVPLAAGATQTVTATLTVPDTLAIGAPFQVQATVNPGCSVPEAHCDGFNTFLQTLILGTPVKLIETVVPSLLSGGSAGVLTVTVDNGGAFALVLPAGILGCAPAPCAPSLTGSIPQTLAGAGTMSWSLQADFTALVGSGLTTNITYGPFKFPVTYSVTGQANYVVQNVSFVGHTAPYIGAQGLQKGENLIINAVIANVGNVTPTGTITVTAACSGGPAGTTFCSPGGSGNPTTTIAAPAAGTTTTAVMTTSIGTGPSELVGTYSGTVTLTTTIPQSTTADDSASLSFELVDFNLSISQPFAGTQNVLLGGTAQVNVALTETGNPTPFPLTITAVSGDASVAVTPASSSISPGTLTTTTSGSPATALPVTVGYSASNHGVTKNATQVLNYVLASITSTTLFLNDASNPLEVQMGGTTSLSSPIVTLKLNATTFGGSVNPATVAAPSPLSGFTATVDNGSTTSVSEGGTFNLQVSAAFGATPTVTTLTTVATLPNSLPAATVSYPLFVKAIGVPDLQIVSVTAPRSLSASTPWLSGEGLDFSVVVKNNGNTASAGGESLTMLLNGYEVDNGTITVPISLGPGASIPLSVHAVAPDLGTATSNTTATLKTKVDPDSIGDLNYVDNSCTGVGTCSNGAAAGTVNLANWHFAVRGAGSADGTPLVVNITSTGAPWSNAASLVGTVDGAGATGLSFGAIAGAINGNLSLSGLPLAGPLSGFPATVSTSNNALQNGLYVAQVIVQLHDGATVTAQRQATIHVSINNTVTVTPSYSLGITCTHNGASCVSGISPAVPIQINGALTEQYTVAVVPVCTPNPTTGLTCQGTADVVVTDGANTVTTPPQVKGLPFNNSTIFQVDANQDANGNLVPGAASGYAISINGIQRSGATSPDVVGQTVSVPVNVGDIDITANTGANSCTGVLPGGTPLQLSLTWSVLGGFNSPSISWQWEDGNHSPVGATPISFTSPSGTSTFGGGTYTALPTFTLTNTQAQDGLALYFFSITVSNGTTSATKYFPFYFDVSVNQNFCGAVGGARGVRGTIRGTWSRSAAGIGGPITSAARLATGAAAGTVDLRVSTTDVSYTPSVPKYGDTVQVRFRVRNEGTSDAKGVPIALQVNGATVASDTFDVAAGRSALGGLQWNTANTAVPAPATRPAVVRPARSGRRGGFGPVSDTPIDELPRASGPARMNAMLVIDPQHTIRQKTALEKSAPLAHFALRSADETAAAGLVGNSQRILLEIQDGACAGLRLAAGSVGGCGSADVELTIADIAKAAYVLNTMSGIADLGGTFAGAPALGGARFSSELAAAAGHSYAVQLNGGRTAVVTIDSIRNPGQLDAATRAVFRNNAVLILRGMGGDSGAAATGDIASGMRGGATVFVQLTVQVR